MKTLLMGALAAPALCLALTLAAPTASAMPVAAEAAHGVQDAPLIMARYHGRYYGWRRGRHMGWRHGHHRRWR